MYKDVGKRIRALREREGFSREAAAEIIGISTKHLYEIEVNGAGFSAHILYKITPILKSSADYILFGKVNTNKLSKEKEESIYELLNSLYEISIN